jgi:hypothetical protein
VSNSSTTPPPRSLAITPSLQGDTGPATSEFRNHVRCQEPKARPYVKETRQQDSVTTTINIPSYHYNKAFGSSVCSDDPHGLLPIPARAPYCNWSAIHSPHDSLFPVDRTDALASPPETPDHLHLLPTTLVCQAKSKDLRHPT